MGDKFMALYYILTLNCETHILVSAGFVMVVKIVVASLEFSVQSCCLYLGTDLLLSYQFLFYFFFLLFSLARISTTMSNKNSDSRYPCFVPDLKEKAFNFHHHYFSCRLFVNALYQIEEFTLFFVY